MSPESKSNIGHSVFQRLLKHAKEQGEDFNYLLLRYGIERLLYRLGISSHADKFILKGASLFLVWKGQNYRVTKDADFLGFGTPDAERITSIFRELCRIPADHVDGVRYEQNSVKAVPIRENHEYDGIRVTLTGKLHHARIPLQIDIGFGDAVTPSPENIIFPTLLDAPAPQLLAYPRYTVVAEKVEAMSLLGMANSRMKDFYDVWLLSKLFEFDGCVLCKAISNTFKRRDTPIPAGLPMSFTDVFKNDAQKQTQWRAFIRKSKPETAENDLNIVISDVAKFLMPVIEILRNESFLDSVWVAGGPWRENPENKI